MKRPGFLTLKKGFFLLLTMTAGFLSAQQFHVDYYGVVSSSEDTNMLKMAQDVFFTQLKSIDDISVDDKRPDIARIMGSIPAIEENSQHIAFFAEITEEKNESGQRWNCKFNAVTPADGITHSKSEIFESYYKILVNAKTAIETVLGELKSTPQEFEYADKANLETDFKSGIDIEALAGTWTGEPNTDKIIILRGGRGFVIFKNGATMNIKISVKNANVNGQNSNVEIKQIGKANASFYPELPREVALAYASAAEPITWNFTITSADTLEGTKSTLLPANTGAQPGFMSSSWTRK